MNGDLAFAEVSCRRGGRLLFEGLSFRAGAGDAVLVSGANGAGKSSLIRVAAGLLTPTAGEVHGEGARALLGERDGLDAERTARAALAFWARLDGVADAPARIAAGLSATGLDALAGVPVRMLSTGQRRRLSLARVIATRAPVWLLDEPANGVDAAALRALERAIAAHRKVGGVVVVATHVPIALPGAVSIALGAA